MNIMTMTTKNPGRTKKNSKSLLVKNATKSLELNSQKSKVQIIIY